MQDKISADDTMISRYGRRAAGEYAGRRARSIGAVKVAEIC